jgi:hypothetical protein
MLFKARLACLAIVGLNFEIAISPSYIEPEVGSSRSMDS